MRLVRALLVLTLSVALGAPPLPGVRAGEAADRLYADGVAELAPRVADAWWKAAEAARKEDLFAFARGVAERVITLAPDHRAAREFLGWERKGKEWVLDARRSARTPFENIKPAKLDERAFRAREDGWHAGPERDARRAVAVLYAGLGERLAAASEAAAARRAFDEALANDPDCAPARKGLGYVRVGAAWLTEVQVRARDAAATPLPVVEASELDTLLGRTLNKAATDAVRVEAAYGLDRAMALARMLEITITTYATDVGRDPGVRIFPRTLEACFVPGDPEWSKWLDARAGGGAKRFRANEYYRSSATLRLGVRERADAGADIASVMEDNAVHCTAHLLSDVLFGLHEHAWLDEGLAYFTTLRVRGTTQSWCIASKPAAYASSGKSGDRIWQDESAWRGRVRDVVGRGDDVPLRMLMATQLADLDFDASLKGWSVVSWLMQTDREHLLAALGRLRAGPDAPRVFEDVFGRSVEELDDAWRAWVKATY